ncbi:17342_t:CDS:2 [Funneliformis caledonium]|uniref:17342_t:CDS:1 n=1 Tax=Funneliformis caledonium TaxID=1117310 RepID=A0A9N9BA79_9GLOM|nr:17342_t:CDS:2 [Funneliformis caledonium]
MSGQDKTSNSSTTSLTSSTANTLTSAFNSTTSAFTSTISSLSSVLPTSTFTSSQPNTQLQSQQRQESPSSSTRARKSTIPSAHSEIRRQSSFTSDSSGNKPSHNVNKLTEEMFSKVATTEDYKLLETMNKVTRDRYKEMSGMAQNLVVEMSKLQRIYSDFEPYVQQIDEICEQVDFLEKVSVELDEYSKELESRLKKLK